MPARKIDDYKWMVQVQRAGERKTRRVNGDRAEADAVEQQLTQELERKTRKQSNLSKPDRNLGQMPMAQVASKPDIHPAHPETTTVVESPVSNQRLTPPALPFGPPSVLSLDGSISLSDYYHQRYVEHAAIVQSKNTLLRGVHKWNYLFHYLGDCSLEQCLEIRTVNWFIEQMLTNGPISFCKTQTGAPRRLRATTLSHATVNKSLQCLKAALNLAFREGTVSRRPTFDLLPEEDSTLVLPPTDEQLQDLLAACELLRPYAPYLPEVVEFAADTGMRRAEIFHLAWGSTDLMRGVIKVQKRKSARMVNNQVWKPKHGKAREIPMTKRVREILEMLHANHPHGEDDLVIPNQGGSPYYPMYSLDGPRSRGRGYFHVAVEKAGLKGKVTFHALRHLFAVRLLTKGAPITVVSDLLGHADIQLTVKRYGQFASDAKVKFDAVGLLD